MGKMYNFLRNVLRTVAGLMGNFFGLFVTCSGGETRYEKLPGDEDAQLDSNLAPSSFSVVDKVLDKIFAHLPLDHLKTCRLVSSHWCSAATMEIKFRDKCLLEFHQDNIRPRFWLHLRNGRKKPLSDLIQILEETVDMDTEEQEEAYNFQLFCTKFEFHGNLGVQEARHFFTLCGQRIKKLVVQNLINYFTRWNVLSGILAEDACNVQELTILGTNFDFDIISIKQDIDLMIVDLPRLKSFRLNYETSSSSLYKVLVGAGNLERVENFDWRHITIFFKSDESKMIKKLAFVYSLDEENGGKKVSENLCQIYGQNLNMTLLMPNPLECHPEDRWGAAAISIEFTKILSMAHRNLKELHTLPMGWLQNDSPDNFPHFPSLRHIQISTFGPAYPIHLFPPMIVDHLQQNFPVLESIALNFADWSPQFWTNSFPKDRYLNLNFVKSLTLLNFDCEAITMTTYVLEQLRKIFGNLTTLKFFGRLANPNILTAVFRIWDKAKGLEDLEFEWIEGRQNGRFEVDAILTGIEQKDCANLATNLVSNAMPDRAQVEDVLMYLGNGMPSIRNLSDLKTLRLVFKTRLASNPINPVSMVSYRYAFNLMPHLQVTVVSI